MQRQRDSSLARSANRVSVSPYLPLWLMFDLHARVRTNEAEAQFKVYRAEPTQSAVPPAKVRSEHKLWRGQLSPTYFLAPTQSATTASRGVRISSWWLTDVRLKSQSFCRLAWIRLINTTSSNDDGGSPSKPKLYKWSACHLARTFCQ